MVNKLFGEAMKKKRQNAKKAEQLKHQVVEQLNLPKDLMFGSVIITVTGQSEAYIENYRGIIEYSQEKIRLQTKTCLVEIKGEHLLISYYTNDEMKVTGKILEIKYF